MLLTQQAKFFNLIPVKRMAFLPGYFSRYFFFFLFHAESDLLQGEGCFIFVIEPLDDPNCFMTEAKFMITSSLWVGNPQTNTPFASGLDQGGAEQKRLLPILSMD